MRREWGRCLHPSPTPKGAPNERRSQGDGLWRVRREKAKRLEAALARITELANDIIRSYDGTEEAPHGIYLIRDIALPPITDPEGGGPLVSPVVCYACPMFEGAAHMPDAANHRP